MKLSFVLKKGLVLLLVLFIARAAGISAFAASGKISIEMKVEAGFDGTARLDSKAPFRISLHNRGAAFNGEVQVLLSHEAYNASRVFAMPCSLASGARKELVMNVPVLTTKKNVEVRLVKGNKVIKTVEYKFKKLMPPYTPVVGIISEDKGQFGDFSGIQIPRTYKAVNQGMVVTSPMAYKADADVMATYHAAQAVELDDATIPDTLEGFSQFDVIVISNYDTGLLTTGQYESLEKWINCGGILITVAGPNWRKTCTGLTGSLRPYEIDGGSLEVSPGFLREISGVNPPGGNISIVRINPVEGKTLFSGNGYPLVVSFPRGDGALALLAFDPGLEPILEWPGKKNMWQEIINKIYGTTAPGRMDSTPRANHSAEINFNHIASNVPESRTPPFITLLLIIVAYIILVGPVLYLFLKWKDKRDWNWFAIPLTSLFFMGIIYAAGFKTRFDTAVMNTFSLIRLDFENNRAYTDSYMGIFNNHKGSMKVTYDPALELELSPGNDMSMYLDSYYRPGYLKEPLANVASKFTFSNPPAWEFYDTMLWEPRLMSIKKTYKLSGGLVDYATFQEDRFKAVIKNSTDMAFEEAFFVIGNIYIYVGNIKPKEERNIDIRLKSSSVFKGLANYLDGRYGKPYYGGPVSSLPKDWKEKNRKRNILEYALNNLNSPSVADLNIKFYAFNYDDLNYDIKVNGKDPEVFNTNLVYAHIGIKMKKGERITIPSGVIKPAMVRQTNAFYEDTMNETIRIQADGDINFRFRFPEGIKVDRLRIKWSTTLPSYLKYQQLPKGELKPAMTKDTYTFFIYNVEKGKWEETGEEKVLTGRISDYVDSTGEVELKAHVVRNKKTPSQELLKVPDIDVNGVVE